MLSNLFVIVSKSELKNIGPQSRQRYKAPAKVRRFFEPSKKITLFFQKTFTFQRFNKRLNNENVNRNGGARIDYEFHELYKLPV